MFTGIIAACWATLMYFGLEGYVDATKKIVQTTKYIERRLRIKYIITLKLTYCCITPRLNIANELMT
jgi:glutamate/tyrosine decarboxylase-like PLP-dependent enzyme